MTTLSNELLSSSPGYHDNLEIMYDLAEHFFKPEDVEQLKTGQFGYNIAAMTKAVTDNAIIRNVYFQENFLNTASTPSAIITFAKQYEYEIGLAIPSGCRILVGFYLDEIKANLDVNNRFIISKDNPIFLDDVEFLLPADVNIFVSSNSSVNVKYDLTAKNGYGELDEFVRTFTSSEPTSSGATRTVLYCELSVSQIHKNTADFRVLSTNVTDNTQFDIAIPTGQQLAFFKVFYKDASSDSFSELPQYFNDENPPYDVREYCFYSYDGGDTGISNLNIYFSKLVNSFRPTYNSELSIEFFTTTGSQGNFNFIGQPSITVSNQSNQPMFYTSQMITTPSAGSDRESLMEIKRGCLRNFLYRESIVIEADLEMFLNATVEKEKVNNSSVEFVKRRDDALTRLFGGYLLLKDTSNSVIPTNTVSLSIDYDKLAERDWVLKPGDLVIYDRKLDMYRLIDDHEYPTDYINNPNAFIYCIPFYMKVSKSPVLFTSYLKNNVNTVVPLSTHKTYDSLITAESFIINNLQVTRNSIYDNIYLISCNITSNLASDVLAERIVPRISFKNSDGLTVGYLDLTHDSDNNYTGTLTTSDRYTDDIDLIIENSIYTTSNTLATEIALPEDLYIDMELFFNSTGGLGRVIDATKNITKDNVVYQLVQVHRNNNDTINLFQKLDFTMFSKTTVNTKGVFTIADVPLVGAAFFLNEAKHAEIDGIVSSYQSALNSAFSLLQNNTSTDIKFFNTYGVSSYYSVDRTNLSLHIGVKVNVPSEEVKREIKAEIVSYVNSSYNKLDTAINISNLVTHLENTFTNIRYIHFYTINGVESQSISISTAKTFLEQDNSRVPELINISTKLDAQGNYAPDIQLDFI